MQNSPHKATTRVVSSTFDQSDMLPIRLPIRFFKITSKLLHNIYQIADKILSVADLINATECKIKQMLLKC